jgi:hypothetical protein
MMSRDENLPWPDSMSVRVHPLWSLCNRIALLNCFPGGPISHPAGFGSCNEARVRGWATAFANPVDMLAGRNCGQRHCKSSRWPRTICAPWAPTEAPRKVLRRRAPEPRGVTRYHNIFVFCSPGIFFGAARFTRAPWLARHFERQQRSWNFHKTLVSTAPGFVLYTFNAVILITKDLVALFCRIVIDSQQCFSARLQSPELGNRVIQLFSDGLFIAQYFVEFAIGWQQKVIDNSILFIIVQG